MTAQGNPNWGSVGEGSRGEEGNNKSLGREGGGGGPRQKFNLLSAISSVCVGVCIHIDFVSWTR